MAAPKRDLFKAAEVCDAVQVQSYMLRSWETEFPQIGEVPKGGGPRLYRRADVDLVLRIKQLVFEEGLTLSGARRRLEEEGGGADESQVTVEDVLGDRARDRLRTVRTGLQAILQLLSQHSRAPDLELVPPTAKKRSKKQHDAVSKPDGM